MNHRSYISDLLKTERVRALGNRFLYNSSYDLFNEYLSETSTAAIFARRMGLGFDGQKEIEFYILLDFLTFIPFGAVGRDYLRRSGVNLDECVYGYSLLLLKFAGIPITEAEKLSLRRFFVFRNDPILPPDAVGIACAVRQLSDRLFNGILLGKCAGSLGKAKALSLHLGQLADAFHASDGEAIDLLPLFSTLPELPALNDTWIEYLKETTRAYL